MSKEETFNLFNLQECTDIFLAIRALPPSSFVQRFPGMKTLGTASYLDLKSSASKKFGLNSGGDLSSYIALSNTSNLILKPMFAHIYQKLCAFFSKRFEVRCLLHDSAAVPGFHIYDNEGTFAYQANHVPHFDLQYEEMLSLFSEKIDRLSILGKTISFTLPISLPNMHSGLRIWDFHFSDILIHDKKSVANRLANLSPTTINYEPGRIVYHSGHLLHQIKAWNARQDDNPRITLQGHGLLHENYLYLYW